MTNTTKEWFCSCGFYGARLHKEMSEKDYSFFLGRHDDAVRYFISSGHNTDNCEVA